MVPTSTSPYEAKDGTRKVYCSYNCPRRRSGACDNKKPVKENWLREVVFTQIKSRLFPQDEHIEEFIEAAKAMINEEHKSRQANACSKVPILESELSELKKQVDGWRATLSEPDLHRSMRQSILQDSADACDRIDEIEILLQESDSADSVLKVATSKEEISQGLARLGTAFEGECATMMNLELSFHIDRIECFSDGRVLLRTCKIGSTPLAIQWFSPELTSPISHDTADNGEDDKTQPRRRGSHHLSASGFDEEEVLRDRIRMAVNPNRFEGLPEHWFWVDEFQIPVKTPWVVENAQVVLARYKEIQATGKKPSVNGLAREFGKSRPTITRALDIALDDGTDDKPEHRRVPKRVKGNPEMEGRIEKMHFDDGCSGVEISKELGISRSAVSNALDRLYQNKGIPRPDGRSTR